MVEEEAGTAKREKDKCLVVITPAVSTLTSPLFFAPFVFCGSDLRAAIGCSTARAEQIVANPWKRKCFFWIENLKCFSSEFEGPAMTQGIMIPRFQNCLNF